MVAVKFFVGAVALAAGVAASTEELQTFAHLLSRQAPGSNAYNCHDNCGQAIIQSRTSSNVCTDSIFLANYQNCLQCAGPDNVNIWTSYGRTLTTAASPCGLPTTPLTGKQADVGPAIPAGTAAASSSASPSSTATGSSATSPTAAATTTSAGTGSSSAALTVGPTVTSAPTSSSSTGTGVRSSTTSSSSVVVTAAAASLNANAMGLYGAIAAGALYAVAN